MKTMPQSSRRKGPSPRPSVSTTKGTSNWNQEHQLDVTVEAVKRLLIWAYENYEAAHKASSIREQMYWDGYIRALHHVMEAEDE